MKRTFVLTIVFLLSLLVLHSAVIVLPERTFPVVVDFEGVGVSYLVLQPGQIPLVHVDIVLIHEIWPVDDLAKEGQRFRRSAQLVQVLHDTLLLPRLVNILAFELPLDEWLLVSQTVLFSFSYENVV